MMAERATEAVSSWMTVENIIEVYERCEECFNMVAEQGERKTARENKAQTNE